jgi:hypothetical protein
MGAATSRPACRKLPCRLRVLLPHPRSPRPSPTRHRDAARCRVRLTAGKAHKEGRRREARFWGARCRRASGGTLGRARLGTSTREPREFLGRSGAPRGERFEARCAAFSRRPPLELPFSTTPASFQRGAQPKTAPCAATPASFHRGAPNRKQLRVPQRQPRSSAAPNRKQLRVPQRQPRSTAAPPTENSSVCRDATVVPARRPQPY